MQVKDFNAICDIPIGSYCFCISNFVPNTFAEENLNAEFLRQFGKPREVFAHILLVLLVIVLVIFKQTIICGILLLIAGEMILYLVDNIEIEGDQ